MFLAALAGGLGGGLVVWIAARAQQIRDARAAIYRDSLHTVHDRVNDVVVQMEKTEEPQSLEAAIGVAYSTLVRRATAASATDLAKVRHFLTTWNEAGQIYERFQTEAATAQPEDREAIYRRFYEEQAPVWRTLNDTLAEYDAWLACKLTRRWWMSWRPCR